MSTIAPTPASLPERRLDAAGAERLGRVPAALPAGAWDADQVPAEYLPHLAWALSLDEWNPGWTEATKRAAIRGAIAAHRLKGTAAGVKGVLDRMGAVYDYEERPGGVAFTAAVTVFNQGSLRISDATSLRQLVDAHKRASVHITLTLLSELMGQVPLAAGLGSVALADMTSLDARPDTRLVGEAPLAAGLGSVVAAPTELDARV